MSEHKCVVGTCCCGCSLRSGTLAIGIVTLVFAILGAIGGVYVGVNGNNEGWFSLVVNGITIVLCALLLQGVRQERRGFVMAWVWGMIVMIILQIIGAIITIATSPNLSFAISTIICSAIAIYLVVVVRSFGLSLAGSPNMA